MYRDTNSWHILMGSETKAKCYPVKIIPTYNMALGWPSKIKLKVFHPVCCIRSQRSSILGIYSCIVIINDSVFVQLTSAKVYITNHTNENITCSWVLETDVNHVYIRSSSSCAMCGTNNGRHTHWNVFRPFRPFWGLFLYYQAPLENITTMATFDKLQYTESINNSCEIWGHLELACEVLDKKNGILFHWKESVFVLLDF